MYQTLVQVLQFLIETFNSLVEPQVSDLCDETTSDELLVGFGKEKGKFRKALGKRKVFLNLLESYDFDLALVDESLFTDDEDVPPEKGQNFPRRDDLPGEGTEREEAIMKQELAALYEYMDFLPYHQESLDYDLITKVNLKKASCLAHR